jgi:hypothetical protein
VRHTWSEMAEAEYLLLYDYGMGGVWAVVSAPSKPSVEKAYPELVVFEERPDWVDDDEYARIRARSGFQFDQPDDDWSRFYRPQEGAFAVIDLQQSPVVPK